MYYGYANCLSLYLQIIFFICRSANTEGMAQSIDSLHFTILKCGAKKALGQLVLLD